MGNRQECVLLHFQMLGHCSQGAHHLTTDAVTPLAPAEQVACQQPKPILPNTGYAHTPYEWQPTTADVQMLRVGQFVTLIMPGELTTMSGRRMR
ncbi:hypothetical protein BOTBODRAFT_59520 [Botryobasidium botryosum FD-172 SS1]|uniref:Neutral/alkaline non-lysosomal ceramidase N-terminal domain-containing protein n=1 Tax=Botryobasidium botryosum (strain FD-172 SS1) TaxID=930990 RepID=A0A067M9A6_BOTB1|nr:hypothetical protein BOTBODRAFT_59520 [Botryobasidium botryosum FD-172 SS1]